MSLDRFIKHKLNTFRAVEREADAAPELRADRQIAACAHNISDLWDLPEADQCRVVQSVLKNKLWYGDLKVIQNHSEMHINLPPIEKLRGFEFHRGINAEAGLKISTEEIILRDQLESLGPGEVAKTCKQARDKKTFSLVFGEPEAVRRFGSSYEYDTQMTM